MGARRLLGSAVVRSGGPVHLVLLGYPGVGKGTYGKLMSEWLSIPHISSGDLIRNEIGKQSELGKAVEQKVKRGELLTDEIVIELIADRLNKPDTKYGALFDGFPRRAAQVEMLDHVRLIDAAIMLSLRADVLYEKAIGRRVCTGCGRGYNLAHIVEGEMRMPAILPEVENVCDSCGGQLAQRPDDSPETVRKRLRESEQPMKDLASVYSRDGRLYDFPLTSGVADMWPKLQAFLSRNILPKAASSNTGY